MQRYTHLYMLVIVYAPLYAITWQFHYHEVIEVIRLTRILC